MGILLFILAVVLSIAAGILGALTGQGAPKPLRRVCVPLISMVFALGLLRRWQLIFLMIRSAVLSQGYGTPTPDDPKPSALGAFWFRILKDLKKTDIAVRATLGIQEALVLGLIPFFTGHWTWYIPAALCVIGIYVYFGAIAQNQGSIKLFGKDLLVGEIRIHGLNTFIYCMLGILCR